MSKKNVKTNAMRILDSENIDHKEISYPVDKDNIDGVSVASLIGKNDFEVFKTLICQGRSKNFYVFIIPVGDILDMKKAAKSAGEKNIEMIHVKDINKVTGYIRGGCSPIGMKKNYPTFIDISAKALDSIIVSAGKIGYQVELNPLELADLVEAGFADLVK